MLLSTEKCLPKFCSTFFLILISLSFNLLAQTKKTSVNKKKDQTESKNSTQKVEHKQAKNAKAKLADLKKQAEDRKRADFRRAEENKRRAIEEAKQR
ncbi:MAG: hypothetical protein H0X15_08955, partial [Acidobacteria bacterium]|nr:hypothetical protein [Acidobacteriota bacterium]